MWWSIGIRFSLEIRHIFNDLKAWIAGLIEQRARMNERKGIPAVIQLTQQVERRFLFACRRYVKAICSLMLGMMSRIESRLHCSYMKRIKMSNRMTLASACHFGVFRFDYILFSCPQAIKTTGEWLFRTSFSNYPTSVRCFHFHGVNEDEIKYC